MLRAVLVAVVLTLLVVAPAGAAIPSGNLVLNPGTESDTDAAASNNTDIDVDEFDPETGQFNAVKYGSGNFPSAAVSTEIEGGNSFFTGGEAAVSTGRQDVSIADAAAEIDAGGVDYTVQAYLGGFSSQEDNAVLRLTFLDGGGAPLGDEVVLGPITADDRQNTTTLIGLETGGPVPAQARTARIVLELTRASGSSNDGYADNLSLTLGEPPPDGDGDGVPDGKDNCQAAANANQADFDGDGQGDVCDSDDDGDGVGDTSDACPAQNASGPDGCPPPGQQNPPQQNQDQPEQGGPPPRQRPVTRITRSGTRPGSLPGGGRLISVTPNQPCQLTSTSRIMRPVAGSSALRLLPAPTRVFGARVTVPRTQTTALVAGRPVSIPVRPVTLPARPLRSTRRRPNPPPITVRTRTTCTPVAGVDPMLTGFGGNPFSPLERGTAGGAGSPSQSVTTTTRVNPPPAPPVDERKLRTGTWGGKVRGLEPGAANGIKFKVDAQGRVSELEAAIAETCHAPINPPSSRQGTGVTSLPHFTNLTLSGPMPSSGGPSGIPRTVQYRYDAPESPLDGTKWIRLGNGNAPGITFSDESHATGTIEAFRTVNGGVRGVTCHVSVAFDAEAGKPAGRIPSTPPDFHD